MNSFWWGGGNSNGRGIRWKSWEKLSNIKMIGGMGFRRLYDFNEAFVSKQDQRLLTIPNSILAIIYKARY